MLAALTTQKCTRESTVVKTRVTLTMAGDPEHTSVLTFLMLLLLLRVGSPKAPPGNRVWQPLL